MISAGEGDNTMRKTEADHLKKISTAFLKKHGYFDGYRSGTMTWTSGWSENKSSVGLEASTMNGESYLRIHYNQTDYGTDEKKNFDYKIPLTTTPCRYGGKRYWFTCPWYKSGKYCGRRVGTLYKDGDYFACRHCYDLTYDSRKLSGFAKGFGTIVSFPELDELREKVKRQYYRGRPTKAYQRYMRKEEKSDRSWIGMAAMLDRRTKKLGRGK